MRVFNHIRFSLVFALSLMVSCADLIQVDAPANQIANSVVFSDDNYAESAVTGIYSQLSYNSFAAGSFTTVTLLAGISADDFSNYSTSSDYAQFYDNSLTPSSTPVKGLWDTGYSIVYMANSVIEGLNSSSGVSPSAKVRLIGEAKFLRGFAHFYLTAMFGDVPLVTTTDVTVTKSISRSPQANVYAQIEKDLVDAREALPESYSLYNSERVRATKYAAAALLSRLYLYTKDWQRAEIESSRVISNESQYSLLTNLSQVFMKNSNEAIWQLVPRGFDTSESQVFVLNSTPTLVSLRDSFVTSMDNTDLRKSNWIQSFTSEKGTFYYAAKYHRNATTPLEYSMVLRLAEQYLIRAEARVNLARLSGGQSADEDINRIRSRAGLPNTLASSADGLMIEVMTQRQLELFAEWGHRWFDLTRTNQAGTVLQPLKPLWKSTSTIYPIPQYERINNHSLTQNDGYSN